MKQHQTKPKQALPPQKKMPNSKNIIEGCVSCLLVGLGPDLKCDLCPQ